MPTNPSSVGDGSVLGESWVIASTHLPAQHEQRDKKPQDAATIAQETRVSSSPDRRTAIRTRIRSADSMAASSSSSSGPELIMPSISDTLMSDGSWVAPDIRAGTQSLLKRSANQRASENKGATTRTGTPSSPPVTRAKTSSLTASHGVALTRWPDILRWTLNLTMITMIMHLLVLPELAHQYPSLCRIPAIAHLYPNSCTTHDRPGARMTGNPLSHGQVIITWHTQLQNVLETAMHDMTSPTLDHDDLLKRTESELRDISTHLKRSHPDGKHELDLEFRGCSQALRAARGELASLKSDMRSAIESLALAGVAAAGSGSRSEKGSSSSSSKEEEVRNSLEATELSHREQYLARLVDGMHSKAVSLLNQLATMDDHLDSIRGLAHRRQKPEKDQDTSGGRGSEKQDGERIILIDQSWPWTLFDAFARNLPDAFRPYLHGFVNEEYAEDAGIAVTERLDEMIQRHRGMMHRIDDLTGNLQRMQKARGV